MNAMRIAIVEISSIRWAASIAGGILFFFHAVEAVVALVGSRLWPVFCSFLIQLYGFARGSENESIALFGGRNGKNF